MWMKKTRSSKLIALLSAFTLAASSSGFTAFALEELSESTAATAADSTLPEPDILSYKEELMPDGSVIGKYYHADGSLYVPASNTNEINRFSDAQAKALPATYDLRDYKLVLPVGNQAESGMCWAYAAIASTEANMIKRGLGTANLSEQHLTWFVKG